MLNEYTKLLRAADDLANQIGGALVFDCNSAHALKKVVYLIDPNSEGTVQEKDLIQWGQQKGYRITPVSPVGCPQHPGKGKAWVVRCEYHPPHYQKARNRRAKYLLE